MYYVYVAVCMTCQVSYRESGSHNRDFVRNVIKKVRIYCKVRYYGECSKVVL